MYTRLLGLKLKQLVKKFPAVAIMGPRQSGKTTLAKTLFKNYNYVSLENFDDKTAAENDPRGFLENFSKGVILDEIQKVPQLFSYLQGIIDQNKIPGKFILTGSHNFLLHEKITQSLAGRVSIQRLLPLSIQELKKGKFVPRNWESLAFDGFYPFVHAHSVKPADFYNSYIQTYVERDIRSIKNVENLSDFQKFLKLCAGRVGQLLNLSSLALDCGISHTTAKSWLNLLEASFIVYLLRPHYKNFNKRLVKMPKLYFYDTGLLSFLLDLKNKEQLRTHFAHGGIFENFIIAEIVKSAFNRGETANNLYFWRDNVGHEIDLIVEKPNGFLSVEIKASKTMNTVFFDNLKFWQKITGEKSVNSMVIYGGEQSYKLKFGRQIGWNAWQGF
ncbi:ATP-binding protein [Candidatus Peregrinibacteria bacterium]|nr:ATP-binding protein [Candidatus Peregrinibacteria bacterium]